MVRAKKTLGQHFLRDRAVLKKLVDAACLSEQDEVLEVGPGEGILTDVLVSRAGKVVAVEKDDRLIPLLQKKFADAIAAGRLVLIHADIRTTLPSLALAPRFKVVANIPYYLTGHLIRTLLCRDEQPRDAVLLLQKEVAKRIVAHDGKESVLSLSVKAYGHPRFIASVKPGSFNPPPMVDSAILTIEGISRDFFRDLDEKKFFRVVRHAFSKKRKKLFTTLGIRDGEKRRVVSRACGIGENARPEDVLLPQWRCLVKKMADEESPDDR